MKLSTKIILPIIIISALLILLNGCISTVPDDSPGYTPGTITGIIASPCCSLSSDPANGETASPEYWCYYCQNTWDLQDGIEVVLTYGEDEVATTTTNEDGEFTFTNVDPGKNYVVTAYCPDFADNRPLAKDVALELLEGGSFDTKTTDLVSTSLGLVVDFLVLYTELGPEDILLEGVIADKPNFPNFPKFKKLVYEVRRVLENCEVNMLTDDDLQDALCFASEEVGRETDPDLVIGCSPGYTPPPTPDPCDDNIAPSIDSVLLDGTPVPYGGTVNLVEGTQHVVTVNASDDGIQDPLTYSATINGILFGAVTSNVVTGTIPGGTFEVLLIVSDGCTTDTWPVTVNTVTYNVYYDANTGTGTQTDSNDYFAGDSATVKNQGSMLKANHTFSRWDTQADGLGVPYDPADLLTMSASDVTLYAQWDEDTKYNVYYDANTGTGTQTDSNNYFAGDSATVKNQGSMLKANHTFSRWDTQADGLGVPYDPADLLTMPASDVTLYAQWDEDTKYNVYYDANTGTGTQTDSNDYFAGDSATVKNQGSMLKANHTFSRWDTQADGLGVPYDPADLLTMPASDVTLYAQWDEDTKYNVTYNGNGNTGGTAPVDASSPYHVGVTVTVLGQGDLARDKYNFTGWNTAADGTGTAYVETDTFTMPAANVVLYAQWENLDPLMSPIDVVPGQNQIRINLRDVNDNPVLGLDNKDDWVVILFVPNSDPTILSVEYGGPVVGPWDFQIRVVNIPQGTLLRNVTVTYNGYGYPIILHEAY